MSTESSALLRKQIEVQNFYKQYLAFWIQIDRSCHISSRFSTSLTISRIIYLQSFCGNCPSTTKMTESKALENATIVQVAMDKATGWDSCKHVVEEEATFSAQAGGLTDFKTLKEYADWTEGFATICPNSTFDVNIKMYDEATRTAVFVCTYHATHTGEGGPVEATGKTTNSEYVYVIKMNENDKIINFQKVWNDGFALAELGWVS
jgi:hypothetical protein